MYQNALATTLSVVERVLDWNMDDASDMLETSRDPEKLGNYAEQRTFFTWYTSMN